MMLKKKNLFAGRRAAAGCFALLGFVLLACAGKSDGSKPNNARCSTEFSPTPRCYCNFGVDDCPLDCRGEVGCQMDCDEFTGTCSERCGDQCTAKCAIGPRCITDCGADCIASCKATESCSMTCGAFCNYTCEDAKDCTATIGEGGTVRCTSTGTCNVTCTGKCRVRCDNPKSPASCNVTCDPENAKKKACADGFSCGIDC